MLYAYRKYFSFVDISEVNRGYIRGTSPSLLSPNGEGEGGRDDGRVVKKKEAKKKQKRKRYLL